MLAEPGGGDEFLPDTGVNQMFLDLTGPALRQVHVVAFATNAVEFLQADLAELDAVRSVAENDLKRFRT